MERAAEQVGAFLEAGEAVGAPAGEYLFGVEAEAVVDDLALDLVRGGDVDVDDDVPPRPRAGRRCAGTRGP